MNNDYDQLAEKLENISTSTESLLHFIGELKDVANDRLDTIEKELEMAKHQQQQSIMLLTELTKVHGSSKAN